jgi:hypothetical protein
MLAATIPALPISEAVLAVMPCPPQGDTSQARIAALNVLKNRTADITEVDPAITIEAILEPGDDTNRFSTDHAATITGYIAEVKPGGYEDCNCHAKDLAHRDTHIALVSDKEYTIPNLIKITTVDKFGKKHVTEKNLNEKFFVIVEVSPHTRGLPGTDIVTLRSWLHKKVSVTGWIFFDSEHVQNAENTNPGGPDNWRATCVEIHPVRSVALIE